MRNVLLAPGILIACLSLNFAQQPDLRAELDEHFKTALALRAKGKHAEAVPLFEKAIELAPKVFGPDHPNTAGMLNTLGATFREMGRYKDAEAPIRRGLAIREKVLKPDDLAIAASLGHLALTLDYLARFDESEKLYHRALKLQEAKLGKDHVDVGLTLANFGGMYLHAGRLTEGETLLLRALKIRVDRLGKDHGDLVSTYNNVGDMYRQMGRFEESERYLRLSVTTGEKAWGKDHLQLAEPLNGLALVCERTARYTEAEELFRRSLAIREAQQGKKSLAVSTALVNLGGLYVHRGRHAEAETLLKRGLEIREAVLGKDHPQVAVALSPLGALYQSLGRNDEAESLARRALKIFEAHFDKDHPQVAVALNNLASVYDHQKRYQEAFPLFERALEIGEKRLGKDHIQNAHYLHNLAAIHNAMGRYGAAEELFQRGLRIVEAHHGKEHPETALFMHNLGRIYWRMGRFEKAQELLEATLKITASVEGETHLDTAATAMSLAGVHHLRGHRAEAIALQEKCLGAYLYNARGVLAFSAEPAMHDYLRQVGGVLPTLVNLIGADATDREVEVGLTWTLRMKGITLDTLCGFHQAQHLVGPEDALAERVTRFRALKQLLASAALAPPAGLNAEQRAKQIAQWRQEAQELEAAVNRTLNERQPGLAAPAVEISGRTVQQKLAPGTALVEFLHAPIRDFAKLRWRPHHYFAFVLPAQGPPALIDLGPAAAIDKVIAQARQEIADLPDKLRDCETAEEARDLEKKLEEQFRKTSAALTKQLFAPLKKALGPAKLVYLAPDGGLNRLPFECLVDDDGKYLIERYQFAYLSSGRDLLRPAVKPAKGTVVFAAPDYKLDADQRIAQAEKLLAKKDVKLALGPTVAPTVRSIGWKALPGAMAEAKDVEATLKGSAFGPVKSYVGSEALEEVLKAMPAPRVLHLATHGFFLDHEPATPSDDDGTGAGWARSKLKAVDNPLLRSGIVLAGANQVGDKKAPSKAEDGWVTAEEIALLDLRGTELVVLSACQTGLGDVKSGEGVYGLRRAFMYAGARTMVTSLFEVPDQETRELMKRFYKELSAGKDKLTALNAAQRGLLEERRQRQGTSHPFFWASFVLVGDPGAGPAGGKDIVQVPDPKPGKEDPKKDDKPAPAVKAFTKPAKSDTPVSYLKIVSSPGETIGQGKSYEYQGTEMTVNKTPRGVHVLVGGWSFNAGGPAGQFIEVGEYKDARRYAFSGTSPGLECTRGGKGSNTIFADFVVWELEVEAGQIRRLAVDFVQRTKQGGPPLTGKLRVNSSLE